MPVYIRGMEMPKDGYRQVFIDSNGTVTWFNNGADGSNTTYKANAAPVPSHGRLVDADTLKVSLVFAEKTAKWAVPVLRAVLMVIDEMPTIIPAEEGK